ncbi:MAG: hypothetical protein GTN49_06450 [candidate division Zixibacteria bacterium]|nr:hypothetical protein [candidate division Zixibacteria bacterium]
MKITWGERYPDPAALWREVECMVGAYVDALLWKVPESELAGIYFKGSAQKRWDSPLDYVPELSDVDVHVLLDDDEAEAKYLGTLEPALELGAAAEAAYFGKVPQPVHVPRPQLLVLNSVISEPDFMPTPAEAITVLRGRDYPQGAPLEPEDIKELDAKRLSGEAEYLARFPMQVIDKPAKYLWEALRGMVWRVSPTAPRVLYLLGATFGEVWTANRTRVVTLLEDLGERDFAARYSEFYLSGWDYFLSGYTDFDAARRALLAGIDVLRRGVEIGEAWGTSGSRAP